MKRPLSFTLITLIFLAEEMPQSLTSFLSLIPSTVVKDVTVEVMKVVKHIERVNEKRYQACFSLNEYISSQWRDVGAMLFSFRHRRFLLNNCSLSKQKTNKRQASA